MLTEKEQKEFWEVRKKARAKRDKKMTSLSFSEKVAIVKKMQADAELLRDAKERAEFGLGELSLESCNVLSTDYSSTGVDWWLNNG